MSDKLHVVPPSHPAFTKQIEQFEFDGDTDVKQLSADMIEMMQKANAAGLAANQLGLEHRVFVLNTTPKPLVCFNPKIVHYSEKFAVKEEGCLTFPGLFVKIRRPSWVRVRFHDVKGELQTETLNGLVARAFQHELDHLDGINYMSRAKKIHMDQAKRKQKLIDRKLKRMQLA
jgi:peptide deformylase